MVVNCGFLRMGWPWCWVDESIFIVFLSCLKFWCPLSKPWYMHCHFNIPSFLKLKSWNALSEALLFSYYLPTSIGKFSCILTLSIKTRRKNKWKPGIFKITWKVNNTHLNSKWVTQNKKRNQKYLKIKWTYTYTYGILKKQF